MPRRIMDITEGKVSKGGVNNPPTTPRPEPPKGQGGKKTGEAKKLLKEIAEMDPIAFEGDEDSPYCFFCNAGLQLESDEHKDDCLWVRVKKFLDED